jgi:hypothetical protein
MLAEFSITKDTEPIDNQFRHLAEVLLNSYVLNTSKGHYRFTEIEFYTYNKDWHPDCFTHKDKLQLQKGKWYFHKNEKGTLKNGKRKGLDITIGNPNECIYGGILLRAMVNMKDINDIKNYIYGPSKLVDKILCDSEKNGIRDIVDDTLDKGVCDNTNLFFPKQEVVNNEEIYNCSRVGLKEDKGEKNVFIDKEYRYFIYPKKGHSEKEKIMECWKKENKYPNDKILEIFGRKTFTKKQTVLEAD